MDDTPAEVYSITVEMEAEAGAEVDLSENVIEDPQLSAGDFLDADVWGIQERPFCICAPTLGDGKGGFYLPGTGGRGGL